jgi:tetratricopeptide (TPR) repeat protein
MYANPRTRGTVIAMPFAHGVVVFSRVLAVCLFLIAMTMRFFRLRREAVWAKPLQQATRDVLEAHQRGDHHAALEIAERLKYKGRETPSYHFWRASIFFELGNLTAAEQSIRQSLAFELDDRRRKVIFTSALGKIMMAQERWESAEACFREAISKAPARAGGYRAMAELILRRNPEDRSALDIARKAVAASRKGKGLRKKLSAGARASGLAVSLSVLVWALARSRAPLSEIEAALNEAFGLWPANSKPVPASMLFFAGKAYSELGDTTNAQHQFQQAVETDPNGYYGRLSKASLDGLTRLNNV